MYLLYLDESGDPNSWHSQKNYVIGGVAIYEGHINRFSGLVDSIQNKYFPGVQINIPFHATEIRRGKGHFLGFPPEKRNQIMQEVYDVIGNAVFPNLVVFATDIDITAVKNPTQSRRDIFEDVCEKFNCFLVHQYKLHHFNKGLLVIDENRASEYRELVNDFKTQGTKHGYLGNVIDIPYFARCHQTRMLQLADFVANAVFRYYENNDDSNLQTILPNFYSGADKNKISSSFGHIIKKKCSCITCK